jgi:Peptidase_C39 like family
MDYPILHQQNPAWADVILGNNTAQVWNIRNVGCLVTCQAMVAGVTPPEMNNALKRAVCFQPGNGMQTNFGRWASATEGMPRPFKFLTQTYSYRYTPFPGSHIARVDDALDAGNPVILEVDGLEASGYQQHFVLLVRRDGPLWICHDPWLGDEVSVTPRFGSTLAIAAVRAIFVEVMKQP